AMVQRKLCPVHRTRLETRSPAGTGRTSPNVKRATDHTGRGRRRGERYEGRSSGLTSQGGAIALLPRARNEKRPHASSPVWVARSSLLTAIALPGNPLQRGGGETVVCPSCAMIRQCQYLAL